jgi:hypothetical protein
MFASLYENCDGGIVNPRRAFRQIRALFGVQDYGRETSR